VAKWLVQSAIIFFGTLIAAGLLALADLVFAYGLTPVMGWHE
jgi:hypothetical protein